MSFDAVHCVRLRRLARFSLPKSAVLVASITAAPSKLMSPALAGRCEDSHPLTARQLDNHRGLLASANRSFVLNDHSFNEIWQRRNVRRRIELRFADSAPPSVSTLSGYRAVDKPLRRRPPAKMPPQEFAASLRHSHVDAVPALKTPRSAPSTVPECVRRSALKTDCSPAMQGGCRRTNSTITALSTSFTVDKFMNKLHEYGSESEVD